MDLSTIGRQYGLDPAQTEAAVAALAPVIAAGMKRSAGSGDGLGSIFAALQQGEQSGQLSSPTDAGNVVLGQIFGSKDVSRGVAQQLSANSGISSAILKQMLPMIAAYLFSQMMSGRGAAASTNSGGGGLGDILGQVLGGAGGAQGGQGGSLGDVLGGMLGGGQSQGGGGLGDILGQVLGGAGGAQKTSAADDLLASVQAALRGR